MKNKFKQDKGVAGLTILLSLVVMLFIIGLLVMIFSIMGSQISISSYTTTTASKTNETLTTVTEKGELFAVAGYRDVVCTVVAVYNQSNAVLIPTTNYTVTNCMINVTLQSVYNNTNWGINYSYVYEADNTATRVMNDTTGSVAGVTSWFDIFIVIGAMVVLILLTVIIITSIRSSGMISGAGSQQGNTVGTA